MLRDIINIIYGGDTVTELESVSGSVESVIYSNDDNGYKVLEMENDEQSFIAVGYFHGVSEGESLKLHRQKNCGTLR